MDLRVGQFSHKNSEKFVFQQPGLLVSFFGILLASIIGLSVRSYFSPERVRDKIMEASKNIHRDVRVSVDEAYLSLSDGYLPQFSITLNQVTFESEQVCWFSPLVQIDQIRLPISIWSLLKGEPQVSRLISKNVSVKLRKSREECVESISKKTISETSLRAEKKSSPMDSIDGKIQIPKNVIQSVEIQNLNLNYFPIPQYQFEMESIRFQLKSFDPRIIVLRAIFNSGTEQWLGDQQSKTTILMEYSESAEPTLKTQVSGQWREGYYELNSNYQINSQQYEMSFFGKHLPMQQIANIATKYQLTQIPLNGKSNWLSLRARAAGKLNQIQESQFQIEEAKLEGDLGEITTKDIEVTQFSPLQIKPTVEAELKNIELDQLLMFLGETDKHPTIHNHGQFNGKLKFENRKNISIQGVHSGLEFIFSNKGMREYQKFTQLNADISFLGQNWKTKISDIQLQDGQFDGAIEITANRDWQNVDMNLEIQKVILNPSVQKLVSSGGTLGELSGQVKIALKQGALNSIQGQLLNDLMIVDGVHLEKSAIQLKTMDSLFYVQMKAQTLKVQKESPVYEKSQDILNQSTVLQNAEFVSFKNLDAQIKTENLRTLSWSIASLKQSQDQFRLSTRGSWNADGGIEGLITYQSLKPQPGNSVQWNISGQRSSPVIAKKGL